MWKTTQQRLNTKCEAILRQHTGIFSELLDLQLELRQIAGKLDAITALLEEKGQRSNRRHE